MPSRYASLGSVVGHIVEGQPSWKEGLSSLTHVCRALAGMLNKVGLLPKDNEELVCSKSCFFS